MCLRQNRAAGGPLRHTVSPGSAPHQKCCISSVNRFDWRSMCVGGFCSVCQQTAHARLLGIEKVAALKVAALTTKKKRQYYILSL